MATSTSAVLISPELARMVHQMYALGKQISDLSVNLGVSNTALNALVLESKGIRQSTNTIHVAILQMIAAN